MKNKINWITRSGVSEPTFDVELLERWLTTVAGTHNRLVGPITYIFCDDSEILKVNREFLQHDYYTDIITFDYTRGRLISGDIFVSLDTVASNAESLNQPYETELLRVIAHGVLHLCGIDDKGPGEREIMERHENEALKLFSDLSAAVK
ncbi:MAG: rRNA maturation RNase YbeY [Muribaculaceae bacterium]|nr:rRNA maturation RNase YbeY [Muribaculaceae bacterium]